MKPSIVCVCCNRPTMRTHLKKVLQNEFRVLLSETIEDLSDLLKKNEIDCMVIYPFQDDICHLWEFRVIKKRFELIPLIITCRCSDVDVICECASSFAEECVSFDAIKSLPERIRCAIDRRNFQKQLLSINSSYPPRVKQGLQFIHSRLTKIKFAEDVSRQLGISVTTFRKEFSDACGIPFKQYLIRIKLLYATYLAENAGLSGKTIALRSCFSDEHQFYRTFRKKMSMSFSQYRAKYSFRDFDRFFGSIE